MAQSSELSSLGLPAPAPGTATPHPQRTLPVAEGRAHGPSTGKGQAAALLPPPHAIGLGLRL